MCKSWQGVGNALSVGAEQVPVCSVVVVSLFALSCEACEWRPLYIRACGSAQVLLGYKGIFVQWQLSHGDGRSRCLVYIS